MRPALNQISGRLHAGLRAAGFVVFRGNRDQQAAGHRDAAGDGRDKADRKDQPVAHGVGDAKALRKYIKRAERKENTDADDGDGSDLGVVARGVSFRRKLAGCFAFDGVAFSGERLFDRRKVERVAVFDADTAGALLGPNRLDPPHGLHSALDRDLAMRAGHPAHREHGRLQ
jgi:hypothetical protein